MIRSSTRYDAHGAAPAVSGPPWPGRDGWPRLGDMPFGTLPTVMRTGRAISWYVGGGLSLLWLVAVAPHMLAAATTTWSRATAMTMLAVFGVAFVVIVPLAWGLARSGRLTVAVAYFALSLTLLPWLGWQVAGVWTYVGIVLGVMVLSWQVTFGGIALLGVLAAWCEYMTGNLGRGGYGVPAIVVSLSLLMAMFARNSASANELRAAQRQVETLAVERERTRMARDIHDILGHSLTVITVKAELAGRLVRADPARAQAEIADVEQLARAALDDVRATVAGARGVTLAGELAAARAALDAASIGAEVPGAVDAVGPALRELAAWVVREGVTNVVRHAHATRCRVTLAAHEVTIDDDGVGPTASDGTSTGLRGLRDRVTAAGGTLATGRGDLGGFRLRVTL